MMKEIVFLTFLERLLARPCNQHLEQRNRRKTLILAIRRLVHIRLQVLTRNRVISPPNRAFELGPKSLNAQRNDCQALLTTFY